MEDEGTKLKKIPKVEFRRRPVGERRTVRDKG